MLYDHISSETTNKNNQGTSLLYLKRRLINWIENNNLNNLISEISIVYNIYIYILNNNKLIIINVVWEEIINILGTGEYPMS